MKSTRYVLVILLILAICQAARASHVRVSNVEIYPAEPSQLPRISFDIAWDGSWRTEINWDAAWVFAKYLETETTPIAWRHLHLSIDPSPPANAVVEGTDDGTGVFIYRQDRDAGPVHFKKVELLWEDPPREPPRDLTKVELRVFAIEMVYIPTGDFWVGSPESEYSYGYFYDHATGQGPYHVLSEAAIKVCEPGAGVCYRNSGFVGNSGDRKGPIPAGFPKGTQAFYAMKYELTQGQYADFLDTLPSFFALQNRYAYVAQGQRGTRQTIFFTPTEATNWPLKAVVALRPCRANNWVSWRDSAAYMDWAALRPMTELEFEKVARGPDEPKAGDYAWGYAKEDPAVPAGLIVGPELPCEPITINGNVNIDRLGKMPFAGGDDGQGPLPGDAFAIPRGQWGDAVFFDASRLGDDSPEMHAKRRWLEGRSYYGLMQLSGNLWEATISAGNETGRGFQGCHGDGYISYGGDADVPTWPGISGEGVGYRGGSWATSPSGGLVANRYEAANTYSARSADFGLRAARSVAGDTGGDCEPPGDP